ncbi:MAG: DeoR family transcriptional regulator [Gammaproteobacteria bacterium]|nr:DeoR family transcriptional regulator [Gammaproteobacteria bacterium]
MVLTDRQAIISELLRDKSLLSVDYLAEKLAVTTQTIRRDINVLCDLGVARRRHGGVEPLSTGGNLAYGSRQVLNRNGKLLVAKAVAEQVANNSSISMGIGTTPEFVANALLKHKRLRIFTNSLSVAQIASENVGFEINVSGGRLRNQDRDMLGNTVETFFESYKTDIGIFGVAGVDTDGTLLDFYDEEVRVRNLIRSNCRQSYLVLDHHKFGRSAHVRGGQIQDVTKVFSDRKPPDEIGQMLENSDAELIICGDGDAVGTRIEGE